jgi:1,4-dihydroxy-2-naphthoate octaprenyltransferase
MADEERVIALYVREQIRLFLRAVRAPFLLATLIPVMLGAAVASAETHRLNISLFLFSVLGCLALHAGANVANDYFDWQSGADTSHDPWPYNGGSQLLQSGQLTARQAQQLYRSLYAVALLTGTYVAYRVGPPALIIGLLGLALGHWYTAPPVAFSYHGLGELATGLAFGPLAVTGSYFVQAGRLAWQPVLVSLPIGLLITAVLYINEFPDFQHDAKAGKRNWVVQSGGRFVWIYYLLVIAAVLLTILSLSQISFWFAVSGIPLACSALVSLLRKVDTSVEKLLPLQSGTLRLHTLTGLLLTLVYFWSGFSLR